MVEEIYAENILNKKDKRCYHIQLPKICPRCKTGIKVNILNSFVVKNPMKTWVNVTSIFFCPSCEKIFFGEYGGEDKGASYYNNLIQISLLPYLDVVSVFSKEIEQLSPQFVKIYKQAECAQNQNLDEICGIGYRKALEFLIKDYICFIVPQAKEDIKKMQLSACIQKYINNERIKILATASAWIGNDETHYEKKHEDYNIEHLKAFIMAMIKYIESEITYLKAVELIEKKD